jgi:hypothetical protein
MDNGVTELEAVFKDFGYVFRHFEDLGADEPVSAAENTAAGFVMSSRLPRTARRQQEIFRY